MSHFSNTVLWVYIVLLMAGGLIGFFKAKSQASLIASAIFSALLILAAIPGLFYPQTALNVSNIIMAVVMVVFAIRLAKTKKFMPAGMLLIVTVVTLAIRNIFR